MAADFQRHIGRAASSSQYEWLSSVAFQADRLNGAAAAVSQTQRQLTVFGWFRSMFEGCENPVREWTSTSCQRQDPIRDREGCQGVGRGFCGETHLATQRFVTHQMSQ